MTRRYIVWTGLVMMAAAVVLNTSLATRQQQDRLAEINRDIKAEEERIRVLTAEWHTLKTPERLEALAHRHLQGYDIIKPMQMAALTDVPDRLPDVVKPVDTNVAATAPNPVTESAEAPRKVASATPAPSRPVARVAAKPATPARITAPAPRRDELADLIARSEEKQPAPARRQARGEDSIRTIIERQQQPGVVLASITGAE